MAAFLSRLWVSLQLSQVHSRSCNVSSLLMVPQCEHNFDEGSNLPIFRILTPFHLALYSNILTNAPHPTSLIECANRWFLTIPNILRSSIAKLSWFLISSVEVLFKKSLRWFATFSCNSANLCLVLLPLYFENLRCTYFSLLCALRKNFGLSYSLPPDVTRNVLIPRSIPIVVLSVIGLICSFISPVSHTMVEKYLPVGVLLIVACFITPLIGRCKTILIPSLNLEILSLQLSIKVIFCGILKLPLDDFFLNLGKLDWPLKNCVNALSRLNIADCKDCAFTSLSHVYESLRSGSCLVKSKQDRFILLPAYAICFVSKAKLYINRVHPICLSKRIACFLVGYILYLKRFSMFISIYSRSIKQASFMFKIFFLSIVGDLIGVISLYNQFMLKAPNL